MARSEQQYYRDIVGRWGLTLFSPQMSALNDSDMYEQLEEISRPIPDEEVDGEYLEIPEPLEFYIIDEWVAGKMQDIFWVWDWLGLKIWGRTTSGQSIYMDEDIQDFIDNLYGKPVIDKE